jgi:hypothetical protein
MIIFFNKKTGDIFGVINGRVHDQAQMKMSMESKKTPPEDVGRFIIGFEDTDEIEKYDTVENLVEVSKEEFEMIDPKERKRSVYEEWVDDGECGEVPQNTFEYFKKEYVKVPIYRKIEHNLDKFEVLKKFEDNTPENPMDYKIDVATNNLIKK